MERTGKSLLALLVALTLCLCVTVNGSSLTQKESGIKDEAHILLKKEDGSVVDEDVTFDEQRDVAVFYGSDGSFQLDDFAKGFTIIKSVDSGACYVVPTGTNKTAGEELKKVVKGYQGEELQEQHVVSYTAAILPGAIQDTGFLSPEAESECKSFYWLAIISSEGDDSGAVREKRFAFRVCRTIYFRYTLLGRVYIYPYRYCYTTNI